MASWPAYRIGAIISLVPLIFFVIIGSVMLVFVGECAFCFLSATACIACCRACGIGRGHDEEDAKGMPWETKEYGWDTGYVLLFIIMYVGKWMMWSGMPLELWCPIHGK
jgi:hypothetical protein